MWATDCPYQVHPFPGVPEGTIEGSLAVVRDQLGLGEEDKEWLLRRTAERVFFFDTPSSQTATATMSTL
eukprot:COSAG05_NODE_829_length_7100_cov_62.147408_2_plen_69_part_00